MLYVTPVHEDGYQITGAMGPSPKPRRPEDIFLAKVYCCCTSDGFSVANECPIEAASFPRQVTFACDGSYICIQQ